VAQKVLAEEGVDLSKVVIGHSGDSADLDYLRTLADAGSYLGMDRFGLDILSPFDARVNTVAELAKQGYAEKMVLAHDAACYFDWFPAGAAAGAELELQPHQRRCAPRAAGARGYRGPGHNHAGRPAATSR